MDGILFRADRSAGREVEGWRFRWGMEKREGRGGERGGGSVRKKSIGKDDVHLL